MSGFAGRPTGNTGCRDPIRAAALFLSRGDRTAMVVSMDLIGLSPELDRRVREEIGTAAGIDPDAILVACSHTHSGPATMHIRATGDLEAAWTDEVVRRTVGAAVQAQKLAVPVELEIATGCSLAAINRRLPTPSGIALSTNKSGPADRACRLLLFRSGGCPLAILAQYEMHPVVLGGGNLKVSADWVGHFREAIEQRWDAPVLFLQGCCGDINPRLHGDDTTCEMIGLDVAGSVLTALDHLQPVPDPDLAHSSATASIPVTALPSGAALEQIRSEADGQATRHGDISLSSLQLAEATRDWSAACLQMVNARTARTSIEGRVSSLKIGPIHLIGLPGEVFTCIGASIRQQTPGAWTVGYSNGNLGYLYPDEALEEGGYEVDVAYRLYGEYQAGAGTARALIEAAHRAASEC